MLIYNSAHQSASAKYWRQMRWLMCAVGGQVRAHRPNTCGGWSGPSTDGRWERASQKFAICRDGYYINFRNLIISSILQLHLGERSALKTRCLIKLLTRYIFFLPSLLYTYLIYCHLSDKYNYLSLFVNKYIGLCNDILFFDYMD